LVKIFRKRADNKNRLERLRCWGGDKQDHILNKIEQSNTFKILYVMPETARRCIAFNCCYRRYSKQMARGKNLFCY
jgi:hypothetical protein